MFRVHNSIISEEVATVKFSCDLIRCKGSCCVVGDAGAPVDKKELPVLRKAYNKLKYKLSAEAIREVEKNGLVQGNNRQGYELSCINGEECIFTTYDNQGIAKCAIQESFLEGNFNWEKPISCHLFPLRIKKVSDFDYVNFEYIPSICSSGCEKGRAEGKYVSEFLEKPLVRKYGQKWYEDFLKACKTVREKLNTETQIC